MIHRGAKFTPKLRRVKDFEEKNTLVGSGPCVRWIVGDPSMHGRVGSFLGLVPVPMRLGFVDVSLRFVHGFFRL